jgi:hypothetical protein
MRTSKLSTVVWIGFLLFLVSPFNCFAGMAPVPGFVMLIDVNLTDSTPNIQKLVLQPGAFNDMRMKAPSGNISGFRLVVLGHDGSSLYEMEFYFPVSITIPPAPPEGPGDQLPSVIPLHNPEVTLIVPYFEDAGTILIMNPGDPKPAAIKSMSDAERETGKDTFPAPQPAPAETGKMNLLIMASGYDSGSFGAFQSQAGVIKSAILGTAPFGSQASKINVHIYANTNNLGCYTGCYGIDRLLCCDSPKVISAASTSGFLVDEIIVVHNTAIYSGGGFRENMNAYKTNSYTTYNAVYDGYYTASTALHEFGHSFGNLCDEYSYGSEGYTYTPCVNCMASCSQYPSDSTCQFGCDAEPGYYRPDTSIMYSLSNPVFNDASILADYSPDGLKKRLNFFTYSPAGSLAASFASSGLWIYKADSAAWTQVTPSTPENIIYSGTTLYAEFGAGGIWMWDGSTWMMLTPSNPENIVVYGTNLYAEFGAGGIWMWNGSSWAMITPSNPENMVVAGSSLYAEFGAEGIWMWNGSSWSMLTPSNPENMVVGSGTTLYAEFGAGGLWMWNGSSWTMLSPSNPESLVAAGSTLYADFGAGGLYSWNETAWTMLTPSNPIVMAVAN